MTTSPGCSRCDGEYESGLHVVRDCPKSRDLWVSFGFVDPEFFSRETWCWIREATRGSSGMLFLAIIWWAWRWRNGEVLNDETWGLEQVRAKINMLYMDMRSCWSGNIQEEYTVKDCGARQRGLD
ncbi:hypothetical protein RIF29_34927 [Crotalaria pallida]|uniref:Reverse transcriptase zinc-binding domain-containing protein n=1 Tax=Crotalaria pallida TaxID=3830 RepID=A0AAN9E9N1_CROPI